MAKKTKKPVKKVQASTPRKLKKEAYKPFRLHRRIKPVSPKLPNVFKLFKSALGTLRDEWKLFLGITLVYGLLTIVLVRGFGGSLNLTELKDTLESVFGGGLNQLATAASLFSYLVGSAGTSNSPSGGVYQALLIIVMSLAVIWALRQVMAGKKQKIRDAFYQGMYPFVQFTLVLVVIGLQLIPLLIGSWLYSTVINNGIAITSPEKLIWALLFFSMALLSLYMMCSSVFALYIVTLPDMTPMKALRSARQLVLHRRWVVLRKILFLPLAVLVIAGLIIIPLIMFLTPAAEWVFFVLSMFVLVFVHSYIYTLYRNLL